MVIQSAISLTLSQQACDEPRQQGPPGPSRTGPGPGHDRLMAGSGPNRTDRADQDGPDRTGSDQGRPWRTDQDRSRTRTGQGSARPDRERTRTGPEVYQERKDRPGLRRTAPQDCDRVDPDWTRPLRPEIETVRTFFLRLHPPHLGMAP